MLRLILSRLIQLPIILIVILIVTYAMVWLMPGDPFLSEGGKQPDESVKQAWRAEYNMDKGPVVFFGSYMKGIVTRFDFGRSIKKPSMDVSDIIKEGMPVSTALGLAALAFAMLLGTAAGVIGALRPRSVYDTGSLVVALIGISLPSFITAAILLALGAGLTRRYAPDFDLLHLPLGGWNGPASMILPAIALGLAPSAYIARLVRLGLADVMSSDFIRTARAKGLSRNEALFKHALKVAYLPVLSFLGPAAAAAMTGSFVVETVFNIPGIGQEFVSSVRNKDQAVILGVVLVFATLLILFNLIVDLLYAWIDPRIDLT